jgi:co-chaperonin GroES (HSP10)
MNLRAINSNVIVKREAKKTMFGSIIIPEQLRITPNTGTVLSVGDQVKSLKEGDIVYTEVHAGLCVDETENIWIHKFPDEIIGKVE